MNVTPGRLPQHVYVRRRITVLLGLLVTIAVIAVLIIGPQQVLGWFGAGEAAQTPGTSQPDRSAPPTPGDTVDASAAPGPCEPERLGVAAIVSQASYAAGEDPMLSLSVTNHGEVACDADLGTKTMVFTVTSGAEVYWDSRHCQLGAETLEVRLEPGQTLTTEPLAWNRTRSAEGACDGDRVPAPAGGASYHVSAEIAGVASGSTAQFLLY